MGCASGTKVPGLPWKDQATALKAPLNQIGNVFCPFLSGTSWVPRKVGPPALPCCPRRSFLSHLCLREREAVHISNLEPFLLLSHTERLCSVGTLCPYLNATRNIHLVFLPSKPDPLFLMSNYIILSLRPLLADSCARS